jgi:hypothetical protein
MKKKISVKQFNYDYFKKYEINNTNRILGGGSCSFSSGTTYTEDVHTEGTDRGSNDNGGTDDGKAGKEDATTKPASGTVPSFNTSIF